MGTWEDGSVRGKLFFEPAPDLDITLTADFSRIINGGGVIEVLSDTVRPEYLVELRRFLSRTDPLAMPSGEVPEAVDGFDNNVHQDHRDFAEDEQWGIAGDINWRVGEHTVRSLTGYRRWYNDTLNESVIRLPMDLIRRVTFYDVDTVSQEVQLLSPTGGLIEYVAGAYFYQEEYGINQSFDQGRDFCSPFVANLFASYLASFNFSPPAANAIAAGVAGDCGNILAKRCRRHPLQAGRQQLRAVRPVDAQCHGATARDRRVALDRQQQGRQFSQPGQQPDCRAAFAGESLHASICGFRKITRIWCTMSKRSPGWRISVILPSKA